MSDGGKGSKPRPLNVSNEEYAARWDAIFGRDLKQEQKQDVLTEVPDYKKENRGGDDTQLLVERA
jgi:hypothetical protein